MKKLMAVYLLGFANTAFAMDCASVDLAGNWDNGRTLVTEDSASCKLSGIDTSKLNDFAGSVIQHTYYDIDFDKNNCVIHQRITKIGTARESDLSKEYFEIVNEKLEPGEFRTFSVKSSYKLIDYSTNSSGRSLTLATCKDDTCKLSELSAIFTLKTP